MLLPRRRDPTVSAPPSFSRKPTARALTARGLALAVLCSCACSDGDGSVDPCPSFVLVPEPYPDPPDPGGEVLRNVAHGHVTQHGLDFLAASFSALLGDLVEVDAHGRKRLVYPLDERVLASSGPLAVRDGCLGEPDEPCAVPTPVSTVSLDLDRLHAGLTLTWLPADEHGRPGLRAHIRDIAVHLDLALVLNFEGLLSAAACHLRDRTDHQAALRPAALGFDLRLHMEPHAQGPQLELLVENAFVDLADPGDDILSELQIGPCDGGKESPSCRDPVCDANPEACHRLCDAIGLFGRLGGVFASLLQPVLDAFVPSLAASAGETLTQLIAEVPLAMQRRVPLVPNFGSALANANDLKVNVTASGDLRLQGTGLGRGLDVPIHAGVTAPRHACVGSALPPSIAELAGTPPSLSGYVALHEPFPEPGVVPYHAAITMSEALLAQGFWQLFQAGSTCLSFDSAELAAEPGTALHVTTATLATFDKALASLADPDAPVMARVRSLRPPFVRVDSRLDGASETPGHLFDIVLRETQIDLYMLVDDQMRRVSGVLADLAASFGLLHTDRRTVNVALQDLRVTRVEELYNELAPGADVPTLLKMFVETAMSLVVDGGTGMRFDVGCRVEDLLGERLKTRALTVRAERGPDGSGHLVVYLAFCTDEDLSNPDVPGCYDPTGSTLSCSSVF